MRALSNPPFGNYHVWWSLAESKYAGTALFVKKCFKPKSVVFNLDKIGILLHRFCFCIYGIRFFILVNVNIFSCQILMIFFTDENMKTIDLNLYSSTVWAYSCVTLKESQSYCRKDLPWGVFRIFLNIILQCFGCWNFFSITNLLYIYSKLQFNFLN